MGEAPVDLRLRSVLNNIFSSYARVESACRKPLSKINRVRFFLCSSTKANIINLVLCLFNLILLVAQQI